VAQVIGDRYFTLLEVSIKPGTKLAVEQKVHIGKENRLEVEKIKRRIEFNDLSASARSELNTVLKTIITEREPDFVAFFNKCGPVSIRLHQLDLLPGIGKKHMLEILDQREAKPFASFKDIQERVALMPDPAHVLVTRITEELEGRSQHYIFAKPPFKKF
jgi:putative nucleotide binding protein